MGFYNSSKRKLATAAFAAYTLLIAVLSLSPAAGTVQLWDKPLHSAAYLFYLLLAVPLCRRIEHLYWMAGGIFIYSGLMELAQHFVPGRHMSLADILANGLGIAVGLVLARTRLGITEKASADGDSP